MILRALLATTSPIGTSKMHYIAAFPFLATLASAQYLVDSSSFGQDGKISPNGYGIPGWHVSGEGQVPQLLSDKVVLTPPYPGNTRGAVWSESSVTQSDWMADLEFRASGPDRGGGNLQLWYTKDGRSSIGTSSLYTVGNFDGMVLVIDQYGGKVRVNESHLTRLLTLSGWKYTRFHE